MKTTILIKESRTQLVLHPESEHDKATLDILEKMPNTHRVDLYDRQGGFTMFSAPVRDSLGSGELIGSDLMVVFDEPKEKSAFKDADTSKGRTGEMTGKEWYEKFAAEYSKTHGILTNGCQREAYQAAKKASGIENE